MNETFAPTTVRRTRCGRCLRPTSACLCAWITLTANEVDVLLLQHPLETRQAKGSVTLLQLSLAHSALVIGETLPADVLAAHLGKPTPSGLLPVNVLLYPDDASAMPGHAAGPRHPGDAGLAPIVGAAELASLRLVVIDGTWRKSLKMLHLHPALQTLPRLALPDTTPSRYLIRKAPRPGQFSTLEATCQALAQLEGMPDRYVPLLAAFDGFVDGLAQCRRRAMDQGHTPA
jgi:DTW domain-containing protein YfiP